MYSAEDVICMQTPFNQVRLESIAPAPDESAADHHKAVTVQDIPKPEPDELLVKTLLSPIHPCDILSAAGLVPHRAGARDGRDNVQYLPGIEAVGQSRPWDRNCRTASAQANACLCVVGHPGGDGRKLTACGLSM